MTENLTGDVWSVSGQLTGAQIPETLPIEAIVKVETISEEGSDAKPVHQVRLILDSSLHNSTLAGRRILLYSNAQPFTLPGKPKKGMSITFPTPLYVTTEPIKK